MDATNVIRPYFDQQLEERIKKVEIAVETWAKQNDLWYDACFRRVVKSFGHGNRHANSNHTAGRRTSSPSW